MEGENARNSLSKGLCQGIGGRKSREHVRICMAYFEQKGCLICNDSGMAPFDDKLNAIFLFNDITRLMGDIGSLIV